MQVERLLRLADKLQGRGPYIDVGPIPTKKFNMGIWVGAWSKAYRRFRELSRFRQGDEERAIVVPPEVADKDGARYILMKECGSAACACGWAGTDPWFQEQEFYALTNGRIMFRNNGLTGYDAAGAFFDISDGQCRHLFSPRHYYCKVTPDIVADRIRATVYQHTRELVDDPRAVRAEPDLPTTPPSDTIKAPNNKASTASYNDWLDDLTERVRKRDEE